MQYAVSHALLGTTFVAIMDDTGSKPDIIRLRDDNSKEMFILQTLMPGDTLYTDMGGSSDKLALVATTRGVDVRRIPTFKLGNKAACRETVDRMHWDVEDESSHGGETGDELTARKMRALAMTVAAATHPDLYIANRDEDQVLLRVKHEYRSFRMMQKVLLANVQRMLSVYNDRYMLELARDAQNSAGLLSGKNVSSKAAMRAVNALLVDIPESERGAFVAKLGLDKLEGKKMVPRKAVKDMFRKIIDALLEAGPLSPFMVEMASLEKSITKLLKSHQIYRTVFVPIPGCGPRIGARMMAAIVDIRRFESAASLKAYAGYHHFEDGSRARRRAGKVSNWNTELKQAVYLWTEQVIKMPGTHWRLRLDQRRAYELYKLLRDRQEQVDADDLSYEILPTEFVGRTIASANDMTEADLDKLSAHVDALRKKAGVKAHKNDEEEAEEGEEAEIIAKDPKLAKLVRGVKMSALQKAKRWLGQQLLKHIFKKWNAVLTSLSPHESPSAQARTVAGQHEVQAQA